MYPMGNMDDISAGTKKNMTSIFTGSAIQCNGTGLNVMEEYSNNRSG